MNENIQKLNLIANKMGISLVFNKKSDDLGFSKIQNISKPNRPEVKKQIQKQLEAIK